MNAHARSVHRQHAARLSPSVCALASGALQALLSGPFISPAVRILRFACLRSLLGNPYLRVVALDKKPIALAPEVRSALSNCFVRLMRRTRPEWPASAAPLEVWEWRRQGPKALERRAPSRSGRELSYLTLIFPQRDSIR